MVTTLERLAPQAGAVRAAVMELVRNREFKYPLAVLPLIVHAVKTGAPEPAVPLAVVHELWWTSACHLDDLADGQSAYLAGGLGRAEALLAAVVSGSPLPLLVVQSQAVPESARATRWSRLPREVRCPRGVFPPLRRACPEVARRREGFL
ncbi:hypothetical protein OOK58_07020 [Streptomyces sp. NBC_01728]|uniref:hypothetical protein n=1 Tax=unclassified Streptomyces TaxID=2593676 RepID=UPI00225BF66D|nr:MULTISPECIES: hypothetical protein [unclassified Streptomyces]MCX4451875.1 hypothetical protein [Streptomyces sp. NBC_01719]MCX4491235.1 hypothetical protein [Streptomyces sp. NBC_01728]